MTEDIGSIPDRRPRLLVVDDDEHLCWAMERAFARRSYDVRIAHSVSQATEVLRSWLPEFAVVDLRLPGPAGLSLVAHIKRVSPDTHVVVQTGFASIATAVEAIKLGAVHYLVKPVDAEAVEAAFRRTRGDDSVAPSENLLSVQRLAWEHIQRALSEHGGNISATARALHMPRRTLQRKLNKHPMPR
jgi:two-component system, response regulator RegA